MSKTDISEIEEQFLTYLHKAGDQLVNTSAPGESVWGRGHRHQQAYARPSGRVLHRLKRKKLVCHVTRHYNDTDGWVLTSQGRQLIEDRINAAEEKT